MTEDIFMRPEMFECIVALYHWTPPEGATYHVTLVPTRGDIIASLAKGPCHEHALFRQETGWEVSDAMKLLARRLKARCRIMAEKRAQLDAERDDCRCNEDQNRKGNDPC